MTPADAATGTLTGLIAAEIRLLRKNRGMQGPGLGQRLGLHLRELAAGTSSDDLSALRHALAAELSDRAAQLPADLRTAVMASLALSAETRQMPHFGDRVCWLAEHFGYNYRTALRRIGNAEELLAEEITRELERRRGRSAAAPNGWYLAELRSVLRLDTPTPEAHERRRIVATRADLTEVMAWLDVPRAPGESRPGLLAEVGFGGRLIRREQSSSRFQFVVQLPRPLQPGDEHEYELILRMPEGEHMRPHYIFTPECQCNTFDLRVRFHPDNLPTWIRRVRGETVRMFEAAYPDGAPALAPAAGGLIMPDKAGEIHLHFSRLEKYLGYGVQWYP